MMQLSIEEPKIEQFFNHSKDEIMKALKFIVDNNINHFNVNTDNEALSFEQKEELSKRIKSFHNDPLIGRSWSEIKNTISK